MIGQADHTARRNVAAHIAFHDPAKCQHMIRLRIRINGRKKSDDSEVRPTESIPPARQATGGTVMEAATRKETLYDDAVWPDFR